jgi:hypothetical protein
LTPAARTRTRTSPGPGSGSGRSWTRMTSGGPCSVMTSARTCPSFQPRVWLGYPGGAGAGRRRGGQARLCRRSPGSPQAASTATQVRLEALAARRRAGLPVRRRGAHLARRRRAGGPRRCAGRRCESARVPAACDRFRPDALRGFHGRLDGLIRRVAGIHPRRRRRAARDRRHDAGREGLRHTCGATADGTLRGLLRARSDGWILPRACGLATE